MEDKDFALLRRIVFDCASAIQDADSKLQKADDWYELANELDRARQMAEHQGDALIEKEEAF